MIKVTSKRKRKGISQIEIGRSSYRANRLIGMTYYHVSPGLAGQAGPLISGLPFQETNPGKGLLQKLMDRDKKALFRCPVFSGIL